VPTMPLLFRSTLTALLLAGATLPTLGQDVGGNQVWLGQVGGSNLIDILQEGRDNVAGADNIWLLLGQSGSDNSLVLTQYGYSNALGTLFADEPAFARGVWQRGNLNAIDIEQRGSVQQYSPITGLPPANQLKVVQTGTLGGHFIGRIVQFNARDVGASNVVQIEQGEDPAFGVGRGNILANVRQVGQGHSLRASQHGQNNRVGEIPVNLNQLPIGGVVQLGNGQSASIEMRGADNALEYLSQYGGRNAAAVLLSGTGNSIFQILQNSESWLSETVGNNLDVTISGEGNGGQGWVGEFLLPGALAMPGIVQGVLQQLGEGNDLRLSIDHGVDSRFGASQNGDGNDAYVSIASLGGNSDARANTSALFQNGDLNVVSHEVRGDENLGAFAQIGNENRLAITQIGVGNSVVARMDGDKNNAAAAGLSGPALSVSALVPDLAAGDVKQTGAGNAGTFDVSGNYNAFVASQSGDGNQITVTIGGNNNSLAVIQSGDHSQSISSQFGSGNSLGVHQF
jgi:hypothetical protein